MAWAWSVRVCVSMIAVHIHLSGPSLLVNVTCQFIIHVNETTQLIAVNHSFVRVSTPARHHLVILFAFAPSKTTRARPQPYDESINY